MQHLGAGIDLLVTVRDRDRVELTARVVAAQDAARIFPGDRRTGLDLGPGNLRIVAAAIATLGNEIVDAAFALGVAGIQFCTVEYLISASSSATSSTTAACNWFSSRCGAVQPSR